MRFSNLSYSAGLPPSVVDIFCGPGGLSQGFIQAGFKVLVAVDQNGDACRTYSTNHPEVKCIQRDIFSVSGNEIVSTARTKGAGKIDVIIGGPPCRGLSTANRRTGGIDNPQNRLIREYVRLVKEIRPEAFVLENVRSLYYFMHGQFKNDIIRELEGEGYHTSGSVLNAANYGVPQFRNRTFIVGTLDGEFSFPKETHGPGMPHKYLSVREALTDLPIISKGGGGSLVCQYTKRAKHRYQVVMRRHSKAVHNHLTSRNHTEVITRIEAVPEGGNWIDIKALLRRTGKYGNIWNTHSSLYRRMNRRKPAFTILNLRKNMYLHYSQDRLLSVREAARLQSFPDTYIFSGCLASMQQQVADAVPPLLARAVAYRLKRTLFPSREIEGPQGPNATFDEFKKVYTRSAPLVLAK